MVNKVNPVPMSTFTLTPAQRATLTALKAEEQRETSASEFCRLYLPFSASKWSKITAAINPDATTSYFDDISADSAAALLEDLAAILESIPRKRESSERLKNREILAISHFRAVAAAVDECAAKKDSPERLVKYLAPTGGGKSFLCSYLAKQNANAKFVESRESWKRSYFTVLEDIAKAIGCRLSGETRPARMEDRIITYASNLRITLVIDEAEFFGPSAINAIKLFLNRTRMVIVISAIPEAHDKWNRFYPHESEQLDRRTHAVFRLTTIASDDCAKFFPARQFESETEAIALLCRKASAFGHYSLLARVAKSLSKKERCDLKEVDTAIRRAQTAMNRVVTET